MLDFIWTRSSPWKTCEWVKTCRSPVFGHFVEATFTAHKETVPAGHVQLQRTARLPVARHSSASWATDSLASTVLPAALPFSSCLVPVYIFSHSFLRNVVGFAGVWVEFKQLCQVKAQLWIKKSWTCGRKVKSLAGSRQAMCSHRLLGVTFSPSTSQ